MTPTTCKFCSAETSGEYILSRVYGCGTRCVMLFEGDTLQWNQSVECRERELAAVKAERDAWRECAQRLAELLNKMPHGHTRACTYDPHGSSPTSDFCTCGLRLRYDTVNEALQQFTELNKS